MPPINAPTNESVRLELNEFYSRVMHSETTSIIIAAITGGQVTMAITSSNEWELPALLNEIRVALGKRFIQLREPQQPQKSRTLFDIQNELTTHAKLVDDLTKEFLKVLNNEPVGHNATQPAAQTSGTTSGLPVSGNVATERESNSPFPTAETIDSGTIR